jgi:CubicO group peptidase (beta-lactamase class C family)
MTIPRLTQGDAIKVLDVRADALVAQGLMSGDMLIEHDGQTIYLKCWGKANRETKAPITADTKFRLGSLNKMFTAVAVLQLLDQKKLTLEDTVGKFLPLYPNKEIADNVTIRELLTNSGGTGDIFGPEFDQNRLKLKTNADYVKLYGDRPPLFKPGTQERYSNYGFVLLGVIIERVSGLSYYEYVREHIYGPAAMTESGSLPEDVNVSNRSAGYTWKDGSWISNAYTLPYRGSAAGGGYSTVGDIAKFAHALKDGTLLPKPMVVEATSPQSLSKRFGYGFGVRGEGTTRYFGFAGGAEGMNAEMRVYPQLNTVIVALSNLDPSAAEWLVDFYANRMPLTP